MTIIRSILAALAGLVFIFAAHMGTDEVMHGLGVFPPKGEPMFDPALNALALGYRSCGIRSRLPLPRCRVPGLGHAR